MLIRVGEGEEALMDGASLSDDILVEPGVQFLRAGHLRARSLATPPGCRLEALSLHAGQVNLGGDTQVDGRIMAGFLDCHGSLRCAGLRLGGSGVIEGDLTLSGGDLQAGRDLVVHGTMRAARAPVGTGRLFCNDCRITENDCPVSHPRV